MLSARFATACGGAIVGESRSQGVSDGEDRLSEPDARNHVREQVERDGGHPTTHARGTERARVATERDQVAVATVPARDQSETSLQ